MSLLQPEVLPKLPTGLRDRWDKQVFVVCRRDPRVNGQGGSVYAIPNQPSDMRPPWVGRFVSSPFIDRSVTAQPSDPCFDVPCRDHNGCLVRSSYGRYVSTPQSRGELSSTFRDTLFVAVNNNEQADVLVVCSGPPTLHYRNVVIEDVLRGRTLRGRRSINHSAAWANAPTIGQSLHEAEMKSILAQNEEPKLARHAHPRMPTVSRSTPIQNCLESSPTSAARHEPLLLRDVRGVRHWRGPGSRPPLGDAKLRALARCATPRPSTSPRATAGSHAVQAPSRVHRGTPERRCPRHRAGSRREQAVSVARPTAR